MDDSEPPLDPIGCAEACELVSAAADDELVADEAWHLVRHLEGCTECGAYADDVAVLARSMRVRVAPLDVELGERVVRIERPARLGRGGWLRPALAWCGLLVALRSIPPLVLGSLDGTPTHIARHAGASTLALGVGLLYVAWRPHRAAGLLPFVAALFAAMLAGAVFDTLDGSRSAMSEFAHLGELVGMVLVWMIAGSPGWEHVERAVTDRRRRLRHPRSVG